MNFVSSAITSIKLNYCTYRFLYYSSCLLKVINKNEKSQKELVEKICKNASKHGKFIVKHGSASDLYFVALNVHCFFDNLLKCSNSSEYLESFVDLLKMFPDEKRSLMLDNLILNESKVLGYSFGINNILDSFGQIPGGARKKHIGNAETVKPFIEPMIGRALVNGKLDLAQKLLESGFGWSYLNKGKRQFPIHMYYLFSFGCINDENTDMKAKEFYFNMIFEKKKFDDLNNRMIDIKDCNFKKVEEIVDEKMIVSADWNQMFGTVGKSWAAAQKEGVTLRKLFELLSLQNVLEEQISIYNARVEAVCLEKILEETDSKSIDVSAGMKKRKAL